MRSKIIYNLLLLCTLVYIYLIYEANRSGYNTEAIEAIGGRGKLHTVRKREVDKKITHLAFLKVPKTGSSTLQNIIFRFGLKNNLRIYLPKDKYFLSLEEQQTIMNKSIKYDIFMIHTIYNKEFFQYFPTSNSATISLIRDPFDRFISAAYYMRDVVHAKYLDRVPKKNYIKNLLENSEKYDKGYFSPTRNLMGKFFGFTRPVTKNNTSEIKQYLDKVNSEIRIVLILERFEESLVLLRRLMKWSFADILFFKLNSHAHEPVQVENRLKEKFRTSCFLEYEIYSYFTKELDKKISEVGPVFQTEVKHFRDLLQTVTNFCSKEHKNSSVYVVPKSPWEDKFTVTLDDCKRMKTNDTDFFDIFRLRQKGMKYR